MASKFVHIAVSSIIVALDEDGRVWVWRPEEGPKAGDWEALGDARAPRFKAPGRGPQAQ